MHESLLAHLKCPDCAGSLQFAGNDRLSCTGCARQFPIRDGAPRFTDDSSDTAQYFGYMWGQQSATITPPVRIYPYHLQAMYDTVGGPRLEGFLLDGGCGDGEDLAMVALDPKCEIVGVELSSGGVATTLARTRGLVRAHVVQGDLLRIPLADKTFDGAYSYGVVHHTPDPAGAVREIARTLKPGAPLLLYVYEDFGDRALYWRAALAAANSVRAITTRMRPSHLMRLCRMLSPVVYVLCTLPARHFSWAARFPYRHGPHAFGMVGDLYDRLSAPIERRYSRDGAAQLATGAGLTVVAVGQQRGWVVRAVKPA
jgi:SAM-dependent methyltransferase